ncbi:unnamed protein product, partial [Tetraodon nigroviridis]
VCRRRRCPLRRTPSTCPVSTAASGSCTSTTSCRTSPAATWGRGWSQAARPAARATALTARASPTPRRALAVTAIQGGRGHAVTGRQQPRASPWQRAWTRAQTAGECFARVRCSAAALTPPCGTFPGVFKGRACPWTRARTAATAGTATKARCVTCSASRPAGAAACRVCTVSVSARRRRSAAPARTASPDRVATSVRTHTHRHTHTHTHTRVHTHTQTHTHTPPQGPGAPPPPVVRLCRAAVWRPAGQGSPPASAWLRPLPDRQALLLGGVPGSVWGRDLLRPAEAPAPAAQLPVRRRDDVHAGCGEACGVWLQGVCVDLWVCKYTHTPATDQTDHFLLHVGKLT